MTETTTINKTETESIYNEWMKISVNGSYEDILSFLSSGKYNLRKMKQVGLLQRIYYLFNNKDSIQSCK